MTNLLSKSLSNPPKQKQPLQKSRSEAKPNPEDFARQSGYNPVAGVDEAGRGPWAGPVVAAAVILGESPPSVPVGDSKKLTPRRRKLAFEAILSECRWGVGIVSAQTIDRVNILQATYQAMRDAVRQLTPEPQMILVDGNQGPKWTVPTQYVIGGDARCVSISCASIVAKVIRDDIMTFYDRLMPWYGFARHKGYGTAFHLEALQEYRPSVFHRLSFRPVANAC